MAQALTNQSSLAEKLWLGNSKTIQHRGHHFALTDCAGQWALKPIAENLREPLSLGSVLSRYFAAKAIQGKIRRENFTPNTALKDTQNVSKQDKNEEAALDAAIKETFTVEKTTVKLETSPKYQRFTAHSEYNDFGYLPTISCPITGKKLTREEAVQINISREEWVTCSRAGVRQLLLGKSPSVETRLSSRLQVNELRAVNSSNLGDTVQIKSQNILRQHRWS
ncbi:hypothetical protein JQC92_08460 [Shewanella sp. 202IG2-18]|uniref:hypothetical protein n=1 Tax=Parashewanella hymeniacidonis TaxID=2807618 RepID=UPI001960BF3C|nr:hypothetical protein [Parashewanella hymeniacidonis]MBM7072058.1 hypothetical protein [Parashewanella hymeniacidonis]